MKISKSAKEETRKKIVETAVSLMTEEGFQKVTMKKIAKEAGIGDATIYKYFTTKEKILNGYYDVVSDDVLKEFHEIEEEYSLQEHLQVFLDIYLERLMVDREFVSETFPKLFMNPMVMGKDLEKIKKKITSGFESILDTAVERGELEEIPLQKLLPDFLYEYMMGVIHFWLYDDSDEFNETTQMVDLSLNMGVTLLTSGLISRVGDFASFIIKTQMLKFMKPKNKLLSGFLKGRKWF